MRRTFNSSFKVKVAIEAIKGVRTINEIGSEYEVHPNIVSEWKKQMLKNSEDAFSGKRIKREKETEQEKSHLYQRIGELEVACNFLKKKLYPTIN